MSWWVPVREVRSNTACRLERDGVRWPCNRLLADLSRRIQSGVRLVSVLGMGGTGKTRLAMQSAAELAGRLSRTACGSVDLAPLRDAALVASEAVAQVLGVQAGAGTTASLQLDLRASARTRRVVLVLDNCEHLVEACARAGDVSAAGVPRGVAPAGHEPGTVGGVGRDFAWRVPSLGLAGQAGRESLLGDPGPGGERCSCSWRRAQAAATRASPSRRGTRMRWQRSTAGWTVSRWRSSWPPRGCVRSRWRTSTRG